MKIQERLPQRYYDMTPEKIAGCVQKIKSQLGGRLCILGHHYQSDSVIRFADLTGDSLKLSRAAARLKDADYIVFCGVHFMAESADILTKPEQAVCLPNLQAGCAMAEMAEETDVAAAIDELSSMTDEKIVPITYVNSSAAIKAVTALADGACCTSGNVRRIFDWALRSESDGGAGGKKIFCIPDRHLGRNIAIEMGYSLDDCVEFDPLLPNGGLAVEDVDRATFILWKGHCYVHQIFTPEHVKQVRAEHPKITVMVHPECCREVAELADAVGSTEQIISAVSAGNPGQEWAIGTESNLVERLARRHENMSIRVLSPSPAKCVQMGRIDPAYLLWTLENLAEGNIVNRIIVPEEIASKAKISLERMINI